MTKTMMTPALKTKTRDAEIGDLIRHRGVTYLIVKCEGEAHSNPHIDYCGRCMPLWGAYPVAVSGPEACR